MKRIVKTVAAAAVLALAFAGCNREAVDFGPDGGTTNGDGKLGYISFASSGVLVEWSGEHVNSPAGSDTRAAAAVDAESFKVELLKYVDGESSVVDTKTLAEWREAGAYGVPFTQGGKPCSYQVVVWSGAEMQNTAWDGDKGQPTYRGKSELFKIGAENVSKESALTVPDVRCTLESIKVSVSLEKSMAELSSGVTLTAAIFDPSKSVENAPYSLTFDEGADKPHHFGVVYLDEDTHEVLPELGDGGYAVTPVCGYFKPVTVQNAISLHIDMLYEDVHISQDIEICKSAKANEYRRVLLYITHGEEDELGKIFINAAIETWTYDEEVVVDVVSELLSQEAMVEETIPDVDSADAPRITSPDFTFVDENRFDASSFTAAGDYIPSAKIAVETVSPVASLNITLSTDNRMLQSLYAMHGAGGVTVDLMGADDATAQARLYMSTLGFPRKDELAGRTKFELNLRKFFAQLFLYGGHHTVKVSVSDSEGHTSAVELKLYYDSENGTAGEPETAPSIVWPGKDMNNRYDVGPDGLKVDITIKAQAGIEHLYVKMSGKIEAGLAGMMPTEFDLTDPEKAQEGLSATLEELKFPVGDDVKGQTELLFDITGFMTMLAVFPGESDFELTVVDARGAQTTAAIKLNVLERD